MSTASRKAVNEAYKSVTLVATAVALVIFSSLQVISVVILAFNAAVVTPVGVGQFVPSYLGLPASDPAAKISPKQRKRYKMFVR